MTNLLIKCSLFTEVSVFIFSRLCLLLLKDYSWAVSVALYYAYYDNAIPQKCNNSTSTVSQSSAKKTFLGQNKSFWGALELVEKLTPEAGEITASVKDLPGLK